MRLPLFLAAALMAAQPSFAQTGYLPQQVEKSFRDALFAYGMYGRAKQCRDKAERPSQDDLTIVLELVNLGKRHFDMSQEQVAEFITKGEDKAEQMIRSGGFCIEVEYFAQSWVRALTEAYQARGEYFGERRR